MTLPQQHPRHAAARPARLDQQAPHAAFDLLVERLTGTDHEVRPAALRELGALADQVPELRARVVAAICTFLRRPWPTVRPQSEAASRVGDVQDRPAPGEPELRRAAVALIADHLRAPSASTSWTGIDLDLAGAVLVGADFSGCWFVGGRVRLEGAWCIEGRMSFRGARFLGADVSLRHWTSGQGQLVFDDARFSSGVVQLSGACLDGGTLRFCGAVVDGGTLAFTEIHLLDGVIDLSGIAVTAGTLSFADARLAAGRVLLVDARLLGGTTVFRDVRVGGDVLSLAGAQSRPGTMDTRGVVLTDAADQVADALSRLASA
jgi:uncharacterized protein YjbI with pentapeptide repeats